MTWRYLSLSQGQRLTKKGVRESNLCVLCTMEACISLMMCSGDVGAVGTTDEAAMGYYLVKWLTEPYKLQAKTEGMAGMIGVGTLVVKGVYFNRVREALYWYTLSDVRTLFKMRHVLWTGLQLLKISSENTLPRACNRMEATRQKEVKVAPFDHNKIMEEAERCDWLDYDNNNKE
jgi:hypothetical protein